MKPSEIADGIMATADGGRSGIGIRADHIESLARAYLRLREAARPFAIIYGKEGRALRRAVEETDEGR